MPSNGTYGEIQEVDELTALWDSYDMLPEQGQNVALDAFVARKNLTINDLVRVGARIVPDSFRLAFFGPGYLKFRDMVTDGRENSILSSFDRMKIVHADPRRDTDNVIVAEGETDAAWLVHHYPDTDVAIMGAGAGHVSEAYIGALAPYKRVLVGLDVDRAGDAGAAKLMEQLPHAERFPPPEVAGDADDHDWCKANIVVPIPDKAVVVSPWVSAGDLVVMETPDIISYFDNALLPVGGQLIIHGWAKSFKSFIAFDMLAALAQGEPWCHFEPTEEPVKVGVVQYEIPYAYYQQRVQQLLAHSHKSELFSDNYFTYTPLIRPMLAAGNKALEDAFLRDLESANLQVLLIDPIRRATGKADLNSEAEVRPLLNLAQRIQDLGVTVVLTHHDNKTAARGGGGDPLGMTGAGAFAGDADTIVSISVPHGATIEDPMRNIHFTLRNAPAPGTRSFKMSSESELVYSTSAIDLSGTDEDPSDTYLQPAI